MKNKYKAYFLFLMFVMQFFAYTGIFAATATTAYTGVSAEIEKYLCAPTPAPTNQGSTNYFGTGLGTTGAYNTAGNDLFKCINQLYKFAIVAASTLGVFFIVIAGYIYMSAEGNQESVDKAKSILVSTLTSLVILFIGFILLKALNPDLVQFKSIQPPSVTLNTTGWDDWQSSMNLEGSGGGSKSLIKASGTNGCNNCGDYTQSGLPGNSTQKSGQNTFLNKDLIVKLQKMKSIYSGFIVNEAFPPTVDHSSACHFNGTCVDVGINTKNPTELDKLCQAAKSSGLNILNEYGTYKASDFSVCPAPQTYSTTTGGHLHLY